MSYRYVIHKRFQTFCLFHGTMGENGLKAARQNAIRNILLYLSGLNMMEGIFLSNILPVMCHNKPVFY